MDSCDVLIVGGGPAGSSCAWKLRQAGLDVVVLDKKPFPRTKPCAGWITPQVVDALDLDTDEYAHDRVFQPITGFRTGMIGHGEVQTRYDEPVSFGIRRCEFDHYLLLRSAARLRLDEPVKSIERSNGEWVVNGEIHAPLLVGAGGHFCPVARQLGRPAAHRTSVVAAQEVEFEVPENELNDVHVDAEVPELFFCEDLQGYGWCFRKGNFLNVGLGRLDRHGLATHVAAFCDFLRERGKLGCAIPSRFLGHAYRLYEYERPKLVDDRMLLVGDSAGLAYPQSGEGIRTAVESALIAADVIVGCNRQFGASKLAVYAQRLEAHLGKPRAGTVTEWLPAAWLRFAAARLLATRWFSRRVVLERWFLHVGQPAPTTSDLSAAALAH